MISKKKNKWCVGVLAVFSFCSFGLSKQAIAESYPAAFDPRQMGTVTPVKQQVGNFCWAYAAVTATEQNYVNKTGIQADLSGDYYARLLEENGYSGADMVFERAMGWQGPVLEKDFSSDGPGSHSKEELEKVPAAVHVQGFTTLPALTNFQTNTADEITNRINKIKSAIYNHGNVTSSRNGLQSYRTDHDSQNVLVQNAVDYPDHVVTIVGWDDSFSKNKFTYKPARDGAFIAKNTWGTNWGQKGYYYISYEDAYLRNQELYFVNSVESPDNYKAKYGEGVINGGRRIETKSSKTFGHVFDAPKEAEKIDAISIRTAVENVPYEIYVNPNGVPTKGLEGFTKVAVGTKADIGAATIKLEQSIPITSKEKFSVVIKLTKPSNLDKMPIPAELGAIGREIFRGHSLDENNNWKKESDTNYLFNVYTNSNEPVNLGRIKDVFPAPNFAAEIAKQLGKSIHDSLTQEEADKIKSIVLSGYHNQEVDNAQGIEYLSNLEYLQFQDGKLSTLDLSKNKKLNWLEVSGSLITTLDLKNNPELRWIDATGSKLTSIDITNCTKLESLQLGTNKLKTIDLSRNPKLSFLSIYRNQLESIDVSKNPELNHLYLGLNELAAIDVTKNPKLYYLRVDSNSKIAKIDLSNNPSLLELGAGKTSVRNIDTSKLPNLKYLELVGNQLKEIDITKNPKLENLYISKNQLTAINLKNNPAIRFLSIGENQLKALDLSVNLQLISLDVRNNQLSVLDLSKNLKLKEGTYQTDNNPGIKVTPPKV
ncbi:hypothetical protein A5821_003005 [Enterococcus sp. 7F3_DIV0205]|uniref:Peptidase C1A papain C-terminal domain-containing protein n=1 Tax=Candidatus Enterococcus palustris TaxID=1834189 RepID=A0AAQ3WE99_9ENTE|nr:lectin like domain-containing protein [Enterococcus sp. 7F3_DIV0205]OTN83439.1 hypothetical protein A5821_003362 [Enterococcus sp. 7F3_DIV0205]